LKRCVFAERVFAWKYLPAQSQLTEAKTVYNDRDKVQPKHGAIRQGRGEGGALALFTVFFTL